MLLPPLCAHGEQGGQCRHCHKQPWLVAAWLAGAKSATEKNVYGTTASSTSQRGKLMSTVPYPTTARLVPIPELWRQPRWVLMWVWQVSRCFRCFWCILHFSCWFEFASPNGRNSAVHAWRGWVPSIIVFQGSKQAWKHLEMDSPGLTNPDPSRPTALPTTNTLSDNHKSPTYYVMAMPFHGQRCISQRVWF